ncbi:hypothetical protein COY95_03325, partial [Candidatus Woesearchaeota archaeon CG_4_10_14_0_8_um_filter_47_5]
RAKELLKQLTESVLPDSQEISDEVSYSVRVMEIQEYGRDRLPAGPGIDESDEIIVVEGRADVINLLKHGIKNAIAMNGTNVPQTIVDLTKKKEITAFVDGDRGGNLIIKELMNISDIDYVAFAPDGKEVEEITKKEIHKALRSRIAAEQVKLDFQKSSNGTIRGGPAAHPVMKVSEQRGPPQPSQQPQQQNRSKQQRGGGEAPQQKPSQNKPAPRPERRELSNEEKKLFSDMLEDLVGTRGACLLDKKLTVLGKVPITELQSTIKNLNKGVYAVVFDGVIDRDLVKVVEGAGVNYLVGMDSKVKEGQSAISLLTASQL